MGSAGIRPEYEGVGHGMNNRKIILGIGVLFIVMIVMGVFHLREKEGSMPDTNGNYQVTIYELTLEEMGLSEDQYQLLRNSLLHVDHMNTIRRRNAWLMLDAMAEIEFVENRSPGESGVGLATRLLELLNVGEIKELTVVDIWQQNIDDLAAELFIRIVNSENRTYYMWYNQTWGLVMVRKGSEDGEIIYSSIMHTIVEDGRICGLEHNEPAICKIDY